MDISISMPCETVTLTGRTDSKILQPIRPNAQLWKRVIVPYAKIEGTIMTQRRSLMLRLMISKSYVEDGLFFMKLMTQTVKRLQNTPSMKMMAMNTRANISKGSVISSLLIDCERLLAALEVVLSNMVGSNVLTSQPVTRGMSCMK